MTTSISAFIQGKFDEIQTRVPANTFVRAQAAITADGASAAAAAAQQGASGQAAGAAVRQGGQDASMQTFLQALSDAVGSGAVSSGGVASSGAVLSGGAAPSGLPASSAGDAAAYASPSASGSAAAASGTAVAAANGAAGAVYRGSGVTGALDGGELPAAAGVGASSGAASTQAQAGQAVPATASGQAASFAADAGQVGAGQAGAGQAGQGAVIPSNAQGVLAAQAAAAAAPGATVAAVAAAMRASLVFPALVAAPLDEADDGAGAISGGGNGGGGAPLGGSAAGAGLSGDALASAGQTGDGLGGVYDAGVGYYATGIGDDGGDIADPGWESGYDDLGSIALNGFYGDASAALNGLDSAPASNIFGAGAAAGSYSTDDAAIMSAADSLPLSGAASADSLSGQDSHGDPEIQMIISDAVENAAAIYGVDANFIRAVIMAESGFSPASQSQVGAQGLMQLMPETSQYLGIENPWDIGQNIDGGTRLLRKYLGDYGGDVQLTLAAYNAGPGAVSEYGGVPPYSETREYIRRVIAYYEQYAAGTA